MANVRDELTAGALGGVAGGLAMAAAMVIGKAAGVRPDPPPMEFHRRFEDLVGIDGLLSRRQQVPLAFIEHMALSAALGAAYGAINAAARPRPTMGGAAYGAVVYALLLGAVGPAIRATPGPRYRSAATVARRFGMHLMFGLLTAGVSRALRARSDSPPPRRGAARAISPRQTRSEPRALARG